jgi:Rap1a immunity proteins
MMIIASFSSSMTTAPASAGFRTGNQLLKSCSADQADATFYQEISACRSYIVGVSDGLEVAQSLENKLRIFCVPEGVTAGQLTELTVSYLRNNAKDRHFNAAVLVSVGLRQAYPCE